MDKRGAMHQFERCAGAGGRFNAPAFAAGRRHSDAEFWPDPGAARKNGMAEGAAQQRGRAGTLSARNGALEYAFDQSVYVHASSDMSSYVVILDCQTELTFSGFKRECGWPMRN